MRKAVGLVYGAGLRRKALRLRALLNPLERLIYRLCSIQDKSGNGLERIFGSHAYF